MIVTSRYFTKDKWETALKRELSDDDFGKLQIVYSHHRLITETNLKNAQMCFLYNLSNRLFEIAKQLKMLYIPYVGIDDSRSLSIPDDVSVFQPPVFAAAAIAEYCLSMAISFDRKLYHGYCLQKRKKWDQSVYLESAFSPLKSKLVGIMGLGRIGTALADCFRGHGCKTIGWDSIDTNASFVDEYYAADNLVSFLKATDLLLIALPLTEETRSLIRIQDLRCMKESCVLINVARASIVNQTDLYYALKNGFIRGAILDVFENEPLVKSNPLYQLSNVLITPHISGNMNMFVNLIQKDFISRMQQSIHAIRA